MAAQRMTPGILIVQFYKDVKHFEMLVILRTHGIDPDLATFKEHMNSWSVKVPVGEELEIAKKIKKHDEVLSAEPNTYMA